MFIGGVSGRFGLVHCAVDMLGWAVDRVEFQRFLAGGDDIVLRALWHDDAIVGLHMVFNVVDDFSRECVLQIVDFSISGQRVANELERLDRLPKTLVCDNGPELTSKAMFLWAQRRGVKLHFIQPGKPTQNAFVESFNGKFREYCLDLNWFTNLEDARLRIERWREHLEEKGIAIEADFEWPDGGRSIYFRDPAGNCLEFAEPRIWGLA